MKQFITGFIIIAVQISANAQSTHPLIYKNFDMETLGQILDSSRLNLVVFSATWCHPCVKKLPGIVAVHNRYRQKVNLIYIFDNSSRKNLLAKLLSQAGYRDTVYLYDNTIYNSSVNKNVRKITRQFNAAYRFNERLVAQSAAFLLDGNNRLIVPPFLGDTISIIKYLDHYTSTGFSQ